MLQENNTMSWILKKQVRNCQSSLFIQNSALYVIFFSFRSLILQNNYITYHAIQIVSFGYQGKIVFTRAHKLQSLQTYKLHLPTIPWTAPSTPRALYPLHASLTTQASGSLASQFWNSLLSWSAAQ